MRIFIIDDDPLSTFLTQALLTIEGTTHDITAFPSGMAALEVMTATDKENMPELIFLDLNMPLMDGWAFLDEIKPYSEKLEGNCTICILTSSLDPADTLRVADYPSVSGLIHKPITSKDIQFVFSKMQTST